MGSSGGGAATLGHLSPATLVSTLRRELAHAGIDLVCVLLVCSGSALDFATRDSAASLHVLVEGDLQMVASGEFRAHQDKTLEALAGDQYLVSLTFIYTTSVPCFPQR